MLRLRKFRKLFFVIFALAAVFQLSGLEEAFCEDSASEVSCTDCLTCPGHYFTPGGDLLQLPALLPAIAVPLRPAFTGIQEPASLFFRPPILR